MDKSVSLLQSIFVEFSIHNYMKKKKDKNRHNFWKQLHFKYKVSIINESTLEEIWKMKTSKFWGGIVVCAFAFVLIVITSFIIIATPIRNYLPGYLDSEVRTEATKAAMRADSLEIQLLTQGKYLDNLRSVFAGELDIDSVNVIKADTVVIAEDNKLLLRTEAEKKYTEKFEDEEKYNLSVVSNGEGNASEGTTFFKPVKGLISDKYDPAIRHFGIDIVAAPKESVVAALEGTVTFAGFDPEVGYVIQIQHKNGFLSVYKHNAMLLKKAGDKVRTGEAIGIVGNTGHLSTGPHLHFELWNKGVSVNPETYISF